MPTRSRPGRRTSFPSQSSSLNAGNPSTMMFGRKRNGSTGRPSFSLQRAHACEIDEVHDLLRPRRRRRSRAPKGFLRGPRSSSRKFSASQVSIAARPLPSSSDLPTSSAPSRRMRKIAGRVVEAGLEFRHALVPHQHQEIGLREIGGRRRIEAARAVLDREGAVERHRAAGRDLGALQRLGREALHRIAVEGGNLCVGHSNHLSLSCINAVGPRRCASFRSPKARDCVAKQPHHMRSMAASGGQILCLAVPPTLRVRGAGQKG